MLAMPSAPAASIRVLPFCTCRLKPELIVLETSVIANLSRITRRSNDNQPRRPALRKSNAATIAWVQKRSAAGAKQQENIASTSDQAGMTKVFNNGPTG
jgi:hypothetical protein